MPASSTLTTSISAPGATSSGLAQLPGLANGGASSLAPLPGLASSATASAASSVSLGLSASASNLAPLPSATQAPPAQVQNPADVSAPNPSPVAAPSGAFGGEAGVIPISAADGAAAPAAPTPGAGSESVVGGVGAGVGGTTGSVASAAPVLAGPPQAVTTPAPDQVNAGAKVSIDVSGLDLTSQLNLGNLLQQTVSVAR